MEEYLKQLVLSSKDIFFKEHKSIKHKSINDLLSEADLELNDYFVNAIKKEFPQANIIAEESKNKPLTDELTFVIDPLDGTCNYSMGIELCGIQLAVFQRKEVVLSIIYLPYKDELYLAKKDGGAFLNGKPIKVNKDIKHEDGVLLSSDFYKDNKTISFDKQFELIKDLQGNFLKTRLLGAACVDFTTLATSKAQAYICYYNYIWDIAPGLLLIKEAGMIYKTINKKEYEFGSDSLVVANNQETLELILNKVK